MPKDIIQKMIDYKYSIKAIEVNNKLYNWNDLCIHVNDDEVGKLISTKLADTDVILTVFNGNQLENYTIGQAKKLNIKLYTLQEL
jgi:hypothetical protein